MVSGRLKAVGRCFYGACRGWSTRLEYATCLDHKLGVQKDLFDSVSQATGQGEPGDTILGGLCLQKLLILVQHFTVRSRQRTLLRSSTRASPSQEYGVSDT